MRPPNYKHNNHQNNNNNNHGLEDWTTTAITLLECGFSYRIILIALFGCSVSFLFSIAESFIGAQSGDRSFLEFFLLFRSCVPSFIRGYLKYHPSTVLLNDNNCVCVIDERVVLLDLPIIINY